MTRDRRLRRARRPRRLAALLMIGLLPACDRSPTTPPVPAPPAPTTWPTTLADRVANPVVAPDERDSDCPRLLSAGANVTEICAALGLADCLVGRTRYCTYPPRVADVPTIGALTDLNVEALLALRPELILVSGTSRAISDRLARLDLRYESIPDTTLADLFTGIERIGALTHRPATAARLAAAIQTDLDTVAARFDGTRSQRVLLTIAPLPDPPARIYAAGPGSFYDDLLRRAGHENVVTGGRPFTPVSLEFILRADPDAIIELVPDAVARPGGDADARAAWGRVGPLRAVAGDAVHILRGRQHFILGPRVAHTFESLCTLIAADE
jgi:iron complex transport system substrate-binding protein